MQASLEINAITAETVYKRTIYKTKLVVNDGPFVKYAIYEHGCADHLPFLVKNQLTPLGQCLFYKQLVLYIICAYIRCLLH